MDEALSGLVQRGLELAPAGLRLDREAGQPPVEPTRERPGAAAHQLEHCGEQDRPDHERIEEDGGGHRDSEQLEHPVGPRRRCVRAERVAPGWAGPPGGGWRRLHPGGCRRAMFSLSSSLEPAGGAAAARSPCDPRAIAAAAVASIACSRRTPKSRPARSSTAKCSGSGATSKHPVPARVRRQPRIGSRETSENLQPATSARPIDHQPELHARTEFLYPTRSSAGSSKLRSSRIDTRCRSGRSAPKIGASSELRRRPCGGPAGPGAHPLARLRRPTRNPRRAASPAAL
jgi:hypothetical protein